MDMDRSDTVVIRAATAADVPVLLEMLRATAREQGNESALCVDAAALRHDGFGPAPRFQALVAECGGQPAGMALYFFNYSTWTSRDGLYLEDLYVAPPYRRLGVARELMARLEAIAVAHGCGRFQWLVLGDNAGAIRFYEALGATALPEWQVMLKRLGADQSPR
jgi:GNAT superfamily N-acetyltransferase